MLQLHDIKKSYTTAGFTQHALDGVSVAFRDNEFAAVLGPSGSGKTTMLNVIGGLDRYDSGDLEIDGISTKKYKDSDWDTYRNNRIGFVFQSYNLIPHQNVLANVELALTLGGVSKAERRRRAKEALEQVGLGEHIRKKPGQLSGGQMQRVAIARALINDPEILLADEPTGALDSTTGVQVMQLLTKIAEDRLVIMVTHNNELAEQYANRIVHLTDGKVTSDSRPFDPAAEEQREATPPRRASMSFLTAIALSFSNLMTKKGRTFTTAFAGSIGIIGIAVILAFSNGINAYIAGIEEDTLSVYPLVIEQQSFDLSGMFGGSGEGDEGGTSRRERPEGTVREIQIMETMFSSQSINDLASLKRYIDENLGAIEPYVNAIQYTYDITPQIFLADTSNGIDQINPDSIFGAMMGGVDMGSMNFMMPGMNAFSSLPNEPDLYVSQYEVLAGRWPESHDEAVLVLQFGNRIMDFTLYSLGIRDRAEMRAMFDSVMQGNEMEFDLSESEIFYEYERLMTSFKVVNPAEMYQYDEIFEVWVDKSGDEAFMKDVLAESMELKIVGIVQPFEDASTTVLAAGVNYTQDLIYHLIEEATKTPIVKDQLKNPEVNVISGHTFEYERENPPDAFDFSRIMSVDEDTFRDAMGLDSLMGAFDFDGMDFGDMDMSGMDFSGMDFGSMDMSGMDFSGMDFSGMDMSGLDLSGLDMSAMGNMGELDLSGAIPEDMMAGMMAAMMSQMPPFSPDMGDFADVMVDALNIDMTTFMLAVDAEARAIVEDESGYAPPAPEFFAAYLDFIASPDYTALVITMLAPYIADSLEDDVLTDALSGYMAAQMQIYMMQSAPAMNAVMDAMMAEMSVAIGAAVTVMIQEMMGNMMVAISAQIQSAMEDVMLELMETITEMIEETMLEVMLQISEQMQSAMGDITEQIEETITQVFEDMAAEMEESMEGFDGDALAEAFQIDISEEAVLDLMNAIMNPQTTSYEQNLSKFGYANTDNPTQISLYPGSFEAKDEVLAFLDNYNAEMERTNQPEKVVHFTDFVGLMMSSVTSIIDMVSYALVAFVSVSLVVSSIMIGVITFVSVLERKKEIGILRAVGASKGNIRLVFNAETLIIGFVAGLIGVIVTYFIAIIANAIIWDRLAIRQLVLIPPLVPVMLVSISMFLTFIAGLIPASAAASKPPVEALRSE